MKNPEWTEPTLEEIIQEYLYKHLEKRDEHFFYLREGCEKAAELYDFSQVDVNKILEPFVTQLECIIDLAKSEIKCAKEQHKKELKSQSKKSKNRLANTVKAFNRTKRINPITMYLPKVPNVEKYIK